MKAPDVSRFSFQVKNSKKKLKAFNRKQHCDKEKTPPIYEPNEFLKFCFQHGALFKFRVLACMTSSRHSEDHISLS